ncbi:MAG: AraC family transcriptional regulator [Planctomycetota bacterium]
MPGLELSDAMVSVLQAVERWRFVSTLWPAEVPVVTRPRGAISHAHPNPEIMIALSGACAYGHGDKAYNCAPGTVFVFDQFEPHDVGYARATHDATHVWISIMEQRVFAQRMRIVRGAILPGCPACSVQMDDLGIDLRRALADARRLAPATPGLARTRFVGAVAALVIGIIEQGAASSSASPETVREQALEAIKRHIQHTAGNGVTVEQLARIVGMSKFHFMRLFKRHVGMTVHQYVDACRLQRVGELLAGKVKLKEIGRQLGYSSPAAFSRWYAGKR